MATVEHCLTCFEALDAHLSNRSPLSLADIQKSYSAFANTAAPAKSTIDASPLFVTWNTSEDSSGHEYELRGCIGTFAAEPLPRGLASYALTAALEDTRFRPIAKRELPHLQVAVTLLTDFEPARDVLDWDLGTHGLRIAFTADGQHYGATYLPDVAPEQGWTKEETVASLMRKAGWRSRQRGAAAAAAGAQPWEQVSSFKTTRYQGSKKSLTYAEYKAWRDWADKQ